MAFSFTPTAEHSRENDERMSFVHYPLNLFAHPKQTAESLANPNLTAEILANPEHAAEIFVKSKHAAEEYAKSKHAAEEYAKAIDAIIEKILLTIADSTEGFWLTVTETQYFNFKFQKFLISAQENRKILRYHYYPDKSQLHIIPMGCPLHAAFVDGLVKCFLRKFRDSSFPESLANRLIVSPGNESLLGPDRHQPVEYPTEKKDAASVKSPDIAIKYENQDGELDFTIVVEVGFSESYEDLQSDAEQWLTKQRAAVNLVILVKIDEDKGILKNTRKTLESQIRLEELIMRFGNDKAKSHYAKPAYQSSNNDSDATMTEPTSDEVRSEVKSRLVIDDWVGPLSAYLEFWELKDNKAQRRGERFPILPRSKPIHPAIPYIDMISKHERAKFKIADKSGKMDIDMNIIQEFFRKSRKKFALHRALGKIFPPPQITDPTFVPGV